MGSAPQPLQERPPTPDAPLFLGCRGVTLEGTVSTWRERQLAELLAYQSGAQEVFNHLTVELGPAPYKARLAPPPRSALEKVPTNKDSKEKSSQVR